MRQLDHCPAGFTTLREDPEADMNSATIRYAGAQPYRENQKPVKTCETDTQMDATEATIIDPVYNQVVANNQVLSASEAIPLKTNRLTERACYHMPQRYRFITYGRHPPSTINFTEGRDAGWQKSFSTRSRASWRHSRKQPFDGLAITDFIVRTPTGTQAAVRIFKLNCTANA